MMLSQPVIIHVPHASSVIPDDVRATFCLTDDELHTELIRMTDWYTDELFAVPGITYLHYPVSRLVVDPERFVDDDRELMSRVGMGAVYTRTSFGTPLRQELSTVERQALLDRYYWPHHRRLDQLVAQAFEQFGRCLIIDAHSFSPHPLPHEPHQEPNRPDYCLGTGAAFTPARNWSMPLSPACGPCTGPCFGIVPLAARWCRIVTTRPIAECNRS